jgi:hypothetical protein
VRDQEVTPFRIICCQLDCCTNMNNKICLKGGKYLHCKVSYFYIYENLIQAVSVGKYYCIDNVMFNLHIHNCSEANQCLELIEWKQIMFVDFSFGPYTRHLGIFTLASPLNFAAEHSCEL